MTRAEGFTTEDVEIVGKVFAGNRSRSRHMGQLVEMERLQQALTQAEERAKNHWDQYLRAVAELEQARLAWGVWADGVRKLAEQRAGVNVAVLPEMCHVPALRGRSLGIGELGLSGLEKTTEIWPAPLTPVAPSAGVTEFW